MPSVVGTEYLCVCASFLFSVHLSLFKPLTASSSETFSFFPTLLTPGLLFGGDYTVCLGPVPFLLHIKNVKYELSIC